MNDLILIIQRIKVLRDMVSLLFAAAMLLACSLRGYAGELLRIGSVDAPFDGYLVTLAAPSPAASAELDPVTKDVYWVPELSSVTDSLSTKEIAFIEPNYIVPLQEDIPFSGTAASAATVRTGFAWEYGLTGTGIRIAVIDSGINTENPNLREANIVGGYDYIMESEIVRDDVSHGTYVAQILVGSGANDGVYGVAPDAEIISLDCFSATGGGTVRLLVRAIRDAIDIYHCNVINMSWGFRTYSETLYDAIRYASDSGAILVASSGNVSPSYPQGTVVYPAAFDEVFGVGAVDGEGTVLPSSLQSEAVFVSAPGLYSNFINADGNHENAAGTSFSAPCLSAEIALMLQLVPELDQYDLKSILSQRSLDCGNSGWDSAYGYGISCIDLLIKDPWSTLKTDGSTEGAPVPVYGWRLSRDGSISVIAAYEAHGKLVACFLAQTDLPTGSFTFNLEPGTSFLYCKVFFLAKNMAPQAKYDIHYLSDA